jgi:hypothetical protein
MSLFFGKNYLHIGLTNTPVGNGTGEPQMAHRINKLWHHPGVLSEKDERKRQTQFFPERKSMAASHQATFSVSNITPRKSGR